MPSHARRLTSLSVALSLALALAVGVAGCGVSPSSPVDIGEGLAAGPAAPEDVTPPNPDTATSTVDLVLSYLEAAVGGGDAAIAPVREFLTTRARAAWVNPPAPLNPTVIRLVGEPQSLPSVGQRSPVIVHYQVIGVLNDQGRVDDLSQTGERTMTFWVAPVDENSNRLRIDQIDGSPASLILSDRALTRRYRIQPVYFWDAAATRLIPDLRYLPVAQAAEVRANTIVQWLVDGPSAWLTGAQRLPTGTQKRLRVVIRDGRFVVDLSAQAAGAGGDAIAHLYYQLRWSLRTAADPEVELRIEGKEQIVPNDDLAYQRANLSYGLSRQAFDIKGGHVDTVPPANPPMSLLAAKENANVTSAGVHRSLQVAALVRRDGDGKRSLLIVRSAGQPIVVSDLPRSADVGRPVWLPGLPEVLLVPAGKRVYAVTAADGHAVDVTPRQAGAVRSLAIAPDGRRVALINDDGQCLVTSLNVDAKGGVALGPNLRSLLNGQLSAVAAAWDSESWLYVTGTSGGAPALWQFTADGVVAQVPGVSLGGVIPTDVVAFPKTPQLVVSQVYLMSNQAVYPIGTQRLVQDKDLAAPFFAS